VPARERRELARQVPQAEVAHAPGGAPLRAPPPPVLPTIQAVACLEIDSGFGRETLSTDQHYGPGHCVPADRGRQFVAGWPATPGDEALKTIADELGRDKRT